MIHRRKHPEPVAGCQPCKWATISFGTVPGGAKDEKNGVSYLRQRERDLDRYAAKRKAGEQPDGTTKEAMDKFDRRVGSWEKTEPELRNQQPAEAVDKLEKSTLNVV